MVLLLGFGYLLFCYFLGFCLLALNLISLFLFCQGLVLVFVLLCCVLPDGFRYVPVSLFCYLFSLIFWRPLQVARFVYDPLFYFSLVFVPVYLVPCLHSIWFLGWGSTPFVLCWIGSCHFSFSSLPLLFVCVPFIISFVSFFMPYFTFCLFK